METIVDDKPAYIPDMKIRRGIFVVGSLCGLSYIGFFLLMSAFGLMHVTELRAFNYLVLLGASFLMLRKWIRDSHHYVPFLKVFSTTFFTGMWSFIILSAFLIIYSQYNTELHDLFILKTQGTFTTFPQFVVLFEGAGASMVAALLMMQYFRRYEDGHPYSKESSK